MVGYLAKMKFAKIRFRTEALDNSDLHIPEYDWAHSVYGDIQEVLPFDARKPLGRAAVTTSYVGAKLVA